MKDRVIFLGDSLTEWGQWSRLFPAFSDEKGNLLSRSTSDGLHLSIDVYLLRKDELIDYIIQQ